jgi:hypothetical protein
MTATVRYKAGIGQSSVTLSRQLSKNVDLLAFFHSSVRHQSTMIVA